MQDVLIVGAGPTGLVLALWLTKQGIGVRIIDKTSAPGTTSRAMAVQARTLELYRQLGLTEAVIAAGIKNPALNLWVKGQRKARLSFGEAGALMTPYPYMLVYPQDQHERLLVKHLEVMGIKVERETELIDFEERDHRVFTRLRTSKGAEEICEALYLAGCDGARSVVRHKIGAGFEGGTYKQLFYVADVEATGANPPHEIHISLETSDLAILLSYGDKGSRLIGTVREDRVDNPEGLTFDDVGHRAVEALGLKVEKVNWFSTYHVHHRVTDNFRHGRIFLAGDAAHVHSPAGGQGMNTGINDAINLAWKLAAVVKGKAPETLLDSYDIERKAFARKLVDTTDRMFTFATAEGSFADFIRIRVAPIFATFAYSFERVREFLFSILSQTTINYRESPVSKGVAGTVHGGDRLPWLSWAGGDNFESLSAITWQAHVYGSAKSELREWCRQKQIPLHVYDWRLEYEQAGFARDAVYVLRPDTYVGLADPNASPAVLDAYFRNCGLKLPG